MTLNDSLFQCGPLDKSLCGTECYKEKDAISPIDSQLDDFEKFIHDANNIIYSPIHQIEILDSYNNAIISSNDSFNDSILYYPDGVSSPLKKKIKKSVSTIPYFQNSQNSTLIGKITVSPQEEDLQASPVKLDTFMSPSPHLPIDLNGTRECNFSSINSPKEILFDNSINRVRRGSLIKKQSFIDPNDTNSNTPMGVKSQISGCFYGMGNNIDNYFTDSTSTNAKNNSPSTCCCSNCNNGIKQQICHKCNKINTKFSKFSKCYGIKSSQDLVKLSLTDTKIISLELYSLLSHYCDNNFSSQQSISCGSNCKNDILCDSVSSDDDIFEYVGDYVLCKNIGSGGQGEIYLGLGDSGNYYAIKKIFDYNKKQINVDNEFNMMKDISHNNIVKYHSLLKKNNNAYIIMDYIDGKPLMDDCIALEKRNIILYTKQIIKTVMFLHKKNIIHMDIKPQNIIIKENIIYLIDFGCSTKHTCNHYPAKNGTLLFNPPEIYISTNTLFSYNIDIWAISVTIFLMFYNKFPFNGGTQKEFIDNLLTTDPLYPDNITNLEKDFFSKVFVKDPYRRLSLDQMLKHPIFSNSSKKTKLINDINLSKLIESEDL